MWDKIKVFFSDQRGRMTMFIALFIGTLTHIFYYELRSSGYNLGQCISDAINMYPLINPESLIAAIVFSAIPVTLLLLTITLAIIQLFKPNAVIKFVSIIFLVVAIWQVVSLSPTLVSDYAELQNYYENIDNYPVGGKGC